ncbi:hypothetical protein B0F90DRAFT_1808156 [Multifurca ochricompacta]|uniref:Phorbol-ester/DAG-type domain-containing protein n=1 Tax=Multifurca ochricompacta TaxID=376703 RepID=A0AAD4MBB6_9AGAM|nr:hypothetical protein B0F90DRAFT_1808156 [Multifurca ochricompacta]
MPNQREKLKLTTPVLRLEISDSLAFPSSASSEGTRTLSGNVTISPPVSGIININNSSRPLSPQVPAFSAPVPGISRARDESQKLLAHVLEQLRHRPKSPPTSLPPSQAIPIAKSISLRPSTSRTNSDVHLLDQDGEDGPERAFSPDLAFDLMNRLRDVLMISLSHQWQIFNESEDLDVTVPSSPFRRRRRSASIDPKHLTYSRIESTELLSQCISVLQSIVSEDCRFPLTPPRPSRPPNSLQAISLDIALLLVHMHAKSATIISQVGFALLPAFSTFRAEMHPRLLLFFEGMLRNMLLEERQLRGFTKDSVEISDNQEYFSGFQSDGAPPPTVSIQVEPYEETHTDFRANPHSRAVRSPYADHCVPSQRASRQSLTSYRLLSLLSPLLAAISDAVDFSKASAFTLHRLRHLFDVIVDLRPDASLNVLETVAYHTPKARSTALGLLCSYWPRALGHCFISKPLDTLRGADASPSYHPHAHQFVLWRFEEPSGPKLFDGNILRECRACFRQIVGLGLFCPLCICAVHYDCYDHPDGNLLKEYPMELDPGTQKVAVYRFCYVQSSRSDHESNVKYVSNHCFRVVNMFTLALCFICQLPLWGCHNQGFKCDNCNHFAHSGCLTPPMVAHCLAVPLTSAHVTITPRDVRNSFNGHFNGLLELDPDSLQHREEILICLDIVWAQLQILRNGLALGSVVIEGEGEAAKMFSLELQSLLDRFQAALLSQTSALSEILNDFFQECRSPSRVTLLFDWSTLIFLAANVRLVDTTPDTFTGDKNDPFLGFRSAYVGSRTQNYDSVPLGLLLDNLAVSFHIHLDIAAEVLLGQLYHIGLFELPGNRMVQSKGLLQSKESLCSFSLPLSLDFSTNVATLLTATEACLSDIDLSVNEAGFLLLVRRAWPTEMSTDYTLCRLMKSVLGWILAEDEKSAIILRDYVPLGRELPGVRKGNMRQPWPSFGKKPPLAASSNNGGDYLAHRRSLLRIYAVAWLLALHDQDPVFYGKTCFELADLSLRHIIRLCQACVVFTTFDDLFLLWLEFILTPILSLQRLLNRESNLINRLSSAVDLTASLADASNVTAINPWGIVFRIASANKEGLSRCLQWLSIFARSAVDIPESVFQQCKSLTDQFRFSVTETYPLIHAVFLCVWMRSLGRQELHGMISSVHLRLSSDVSRCLSERKSCQRYLELTTFRSDLIRLSLATCLLLAGCARGVLISHGLIMEDDVLQLPSRRTTNTRASMVPDPIHVNTGFVQALGDYVNARQEEISVIIAKFFYLFVKECSLLETHEVDNFILRNAGVLSSCVWSFYEMQSPHLSSLLPNVLMRLLVVDAQPLDALLKTSLSPTTRWETRLRTLKQLFRIILDVINPSFIVEDRQWQSSATIIFYNYFTALWQDSQEEVKVAVDTWSQTLFPAHFEAITNCWNDALVNAPVSERVRLVSFLIRLHSLFSGWRVLSWDVIAGILSEEDYIPGNDDLKNGSAAVHVEVGLALITHFQISILLLSLKMIGSGIGIDLLNLLKLKKHLVLILGFVGVSTVPAPASQVFYVTFEHTRVTAHDLLSVLDASQPFSLFASAMTESSPPNDAPTSLLVGSIFVDVLLALITGSDDLLDLPYLTTKRLIECLLVVIRPLRHLQGHLRKAVRRVLNLVPTGLSYELRQLALTVVQTYIKFWPNTAGSFVLESIEVCSQVITDPQSSKEDPLSSQAKSFIEGSLSMFAENGITIALFKAIIRTCTEKSTRNSNESQGLRDILLRDTMSRIVESDAESFKLVMHNLSLFIEKVHHSAYDPGLVRHMGLCLTTIVRRTSEWSPESFDPSPLLLIISTLIESNPSQTREFLVYIDTILRAVLIRFIVSRQSLVRILEVAKQHHLRIQKHTTSADLRLDQNRIMSTILEICGEGLRRKNRIFPSTLAVMAETSINTTEYAKDLDSSIARLGVDGIAYLQSRSLQGGSVEAEVNILLSIAKLILHGLEIDGDVIHQLVSEQPSEKSARQLSVSVWNVLLLSALSHQSAYPGALLMGYFSTFVAIYRETLAAPSSANQGTTNAAANINHCYASVKLWLLLERRLSQNWDSEDGHPPVPKVGPFVIWNELWSPFSDLITAHEVDVSNGQNTPLWSIISSVIADLFHFLREFHSVLTLETAVHEATLSRLRLSGQTDVSNGKLTQTLRVIGEPVPRLPWIALVDQVKSDMIAAEKLE